MTAQTQVVNRRDVGETKGYTSRLFLDLKCHQMNQIRLATALMPDIVPSSLNPRSTTGFRASPVGNGIIGLE